MTSILLRIGTKIYLITVNLRTRVRVRADAKGISDSMNDFILILFFGFDIKNYIDSEIPRP